MSRPKPILPGSFLHRPHRRLAHQANPLHGAPNLPPAPRAAQESKNHRAALAARNQRPALRHGLAARRAAAGV